MRTDPTDNGGLFVGRRPGTAPIRYRVEPRRALGLRRTFDRLFAGALLALMMLLSLSFWGPMPAAVLWVGGPLQDGRGSGGAAIVASCLAILVVLLLGLVALKRLDHFWILVRRAAGYDQRTGMIGPIFAISAIVGVTLFVLWFLLFAGPGPELFGARD